MQNLIGPFLCFAGIFGFLCIFAIPLINAFDEFMRAQQAAERRAFLESRFRGPFGK